MSLLAADGSINVTVVDGTTFTGFYAADGSMNVVKAPGGSFVGVYHPCGAQYVTPVPDGSFVGYYAPDGSVYVTSNPPPATDNGMPVTVVSGSLFGPPPTGSYYPWIFI